MAAQNPVTLAETTDELLNRGRSQGFLSTEEVAGLVQEGDLSATEVEEFYAALEEEEITLASGEAAAAVTGGGGGGVLRGAWGGGETPRLRRGRRGGEGRREVRHRAGLRGAGGPDRARRRDGRLYKDVPSRDRARPAPAPRRRDTLGQRHRPRMQEEQSPPRRTGS